MPRRFRNASGPSISRIRKERGLTQDQLAARLVLSGLTNMDSTVIAKIEGQHRSVFDFELMMIASVLEVSLTELYPGVEAISADLADLLSGKKQ